MKVGDFVVVLVEHPYGVSASEKDKLGYILSEDRDEDEGTAYEVLTSIYDSSGYFYNEDELRLATDREIITELRRLYELRHVS